LKEDEIAARKPFGDSLKVFMENQKMRRGTVCEVTKVHRSLLSRFVNNVRVPSPWKAFQMGWALGVDFERRRLITTMDGRRLVSA
jgi:hypothetical protein